MECRNCYKFEPVCLEYGFCNGKETEIRSPDSSCKDYMSIEEHIFVEYLLKKELEKEKY